MRSFLIGTGVVIACVTFSLSLGAVTEQLYTQSAVNFARACRFTGNYLQYPTATGTATGATTLSGATAYKAYCTTDTYLKQNGTASATGATLKAGLYLDVWSKQGDTMSFLAVAATGVCNLTECQ